MLRFPYIKTHLCLAALSVALGAWCQGPPVETSSRRGEICLNGEWRFMPALGLAAAQPAGDWGRIPVPGSWAGGAVPGPTAVAADGAWAVAKLADVSRVWYELTVPVPASWQGRRVQLELTRVSTDAVVYANGRECGRIDWPSGSVDITQAVTPGALLALRLLVVAVPEGQDVTVYMGVGNDQTWTQPAALASRGIIGEAFLRSQPAGAVVSDVFVRPSVRQRMLSVDVELAGVAAAGPGRFVARLLDEAGTEEQSFRAERPLGAAATQAVTLEWPWPNPRLWDLGQPNLYRLHLEALGPGLDDAVVQEFGFREFWLDGLRFMLNGTEIRLRPVCVWDEWNSAAWIPEAIDGILDAYVRTGFNLGEHWPGNEDERGSVYLRTLWAERADRRGFLLTGNALSMNGAIFGPNWRYDWDKPGVKERWEQRLAVQLRAQRNHPSIVMWGTSANFFGRPQDQNPAVIGRRGWYPEDAKAKAGREGIAIIKRHDPTRPVFTHHGADVGDLHTCNCYLDLIPLQEREEWLSAYAKQADLPFLPIEFGTPLHCTFMRGRDGFGSAIVSEPLMTEFCAIYLGAQAYALETAEYRRRLEATYEGPQRWASWHTAPELEQAPAFQAVQDLFIRNTWRSWRTWGITAGMVPWSMGHGWAQLPDQRWTEEALPARPERRGPYTPTVRKGALHYLEPEGGWVTYPAGQALIESNHATLAWIAGPAERFTAKDHGFVGGETVAKQVVLINDERTAQTYSAAWTVSVADQQVAAGERSGEILPAQNLLTAFGFTTPQVAAPADGRIVLQATIGKRLHRDEFRFRIRAPEVAAKPSLQVFDPEGESSRLLRALGYDRMTPWDGAPQADGLVVVGRHALDGASRLPGSLERHVAAGGRLLIFGQSPEWLRRAMGLRVARQVSRRFFPVPSQLDHPVLLGLDAEDCRDWRGAGTLVPETWGGLDESPQAEPTWGWHWGNAGSVSSAAIEKPHYSGWRPLLEGEFDLAYSPLLELHYGRGLALLCTLDLEGRTAVDPVAQVLACRVLSYAAAAPVEPRATQTVYLGGERGRRLLRSLGLQFELTTELPSGKALAILGPEASVSAAALSAFLQGGGRALLLPRAPGADPWGAIGAARPYQAAPEVPAWPECRGLSRSDLRLRGTVDLAPVQAQGTVVAGAGGLLGRQQVGAGVALLLQLTPEMLPAREKTYFRYSQWRLTRTLTQVLANLGASFEMDARSLSPGWNLGYLPLPLAGEWLCQVESRLPASSDPAVRAKDSGIAKECEAWSAADLATGDWSKLALPGYWENLPEVGEQDGAFWVRRDVDLPAEWVGQELVLQLGTVDDNDSTWFNGVKIGETSGWNVPRTYRVPAALVRAGRNLIAIRVFDEFGGGGFGGRPDDLRLGRVVPKPVVDGEELLSNTAFGESAKGWNLGVMGPAQATVDVSEDVPAALLGQRSVQVRVTTPSETAWHVSFAQPGFGIQAGMTYLWTVWAKASGPCTMIAAIEKNHPPYGGAGLFERVQLTSEWQQVKISFTPRESDDNVRFACQELAREVVTYSFAAPSFSVAPDRSMPRESAELRTFYSPDVIDSHELGDDPYRYYRW